MPERAVKPGPHPPGDVAAAAAAEQPVILYCLNCRHAREMLAWRLAGRFGALPFGQIIGNLVCRSCGAHLAVVLPLQRPNPTSWAQHHRLRAGQKVAPASPPQRGAGPDFHFRLECWSARGHVERCLALIDDLAIGHAAFEVAVRRFPGEPITLRAGCRVICKSAKPALKPVE